MEPRRPAAGPSSGSPTRSSSATTALDGVVLVGLQTGGVPLARRLARRALEQIEGESPPVGTLDVAFYRDDIGLRPVLPEAVTEIPVDLDRRGPSSSSTTCCSPGARSAPRSTRSPTTGGPARCSSRCMVDRGHRELPIRPDYVGKNLPTRRDEVVDVEPTTASTLGDDRSRSERRGDDQHLLSIDDLGAPTASRRSSTSPTRFVEVSARAIPKVPALRGKTVVVAVLRGLHPHPAVVRDRGEAAVGRHHDLQRWRARRCKKGESLRDTVADHRGDGRRRDRRAPRRRPARPTGSPSGSTPRSSTPATAGTSTRRRRCSTATRSASQPRRVARRAAGSRSSATSGTPGSPASNVLAFTRARRRGHARRAADAAAAERSTGWPVDGQPRPRRGARRRSTSSTCCGCSSSG